MAEEMYLYPCLFFEIKKNGEKQIRKAIFNETKHM